MSYRVLIVDDDESLRGFAAEVLDARGHAVEVLPDAEDLVARTRLAPPDLILLDYKMPGTDGLTALRQLRRARELVPVVMMTATSDQKVAVECFRAGADDFVAKPFDPDYLTIVVERTIELASINLRDMTLSLLRYARHLDECKIHQGGTCTCSMTETVRAVSSMMKKRPLL
jgi:DNA-binding response OmpR family regulator